MGRDYAVHVAGVGRKTLLPRNGMSGTGQGATAPCPVPAARPAAGLSKPQNVTEPQQALTSRVAAAGSQITFWKGGAMVDVKGPAVAASGQKGGIRKEIQGMSDASRRNLKEKLAQVLNVERQNGLAVCLTYPRDVVKPEEWETYKNHLRVFNQAVKRRYVGSSGIWVLEFHKSGAPHFHLLMFGLKARHQLEELRAWMQQRWYEIAHAGDIHQGKAGTRIEWVKNGGGVMGYMAKYISKSYTDNRRGYTGRMWGKFGELPLGEMETLPLTPEQVIKVRRIARKKMERDVNNSRWSKFLERSNAWSFGPRMFWEKLLSAKHGGKCGIEWMHYQKRGPTLYWNDEGVAQVGYTCEGWVTSANGLCLLETYKPPKKWKARNNERVRLICHANEFMEHIKQGMVRGLL